MRLMRQQVARAERLPMGRAHADRRRPFVKRQRIVELAEDSAVAPPTYRARMAYS